MKTRTLKVLWTILFLGALAGCGGGDSVTFSYACNDGTTSSQGDPKTALVGCSQHGSTNQQTPDISGTAQALEDDKVAVDAWKAKGARVTVK